MTRNSSNHRTAVVIAFVGTLLVVAYAGLAVVQIFVLNALAAAPGKTLGQIHADMAAAGESLSLSGCRRAERRGLPGSSHVGLTLSES